MTVLLLGIGALDVEAVETAVCITDVVEGIVDVTANAGVGSDDRLADAKNINGLFSSSESESFAEWEHFCCFFLTRRFTVVVKPAF